MNISDIIGSCGVFLILIAYFININDYMSNDHPLYICMNIIGGGCAMCASIMIHYIPFVILEGIWVLVSLWALIVYFKRDFHISLKDLNKRK